MRKAQLSTWILSDYKFTISTGTEGIVFMLGCWSKWNSSCLIINPRTFFLVAIARKLIVGYIYPAR